MGLIVDFSAIIELERSDRDLGPRLKEHADDQVLFPAIVG